MQSDIPKQFIEINGKPIVMYTIEKFIAAYPDIELILVLPNDQFQYWDTIAQQYEVAKNIKLVEGGEERFHSVKNGVQAANGDLIAIHDAVRPCVSEEVIKSTFDTAETTGAAIPVVKVKESMRKITFDESEPVPRGAFRIVQTPQVFKGKVIKIAYEQAYHMSFTDDAVVVENGGHEIALTEGNEENIKITTPYDLRIAEWLLTQN